MGQEGQFEAPFTSAELHIFRHCASSCNSHIRQGQFWCTIHVHLVAPRQFVRVLATDFSFTEDRKPGETGQSRLPFR